MAGGGGDGGGIFGGCSGRGAAFIAFVPSFDGGFGGHGVVGVLGRRWWSLEKVRLLGCRQGRRDTAWGGGELYVSRDCSNRVRIERR